MLSKSGLFVFTLLLSNSTPLNANIFHEKDATEAPAETTNNTSCDSRVKQASVKLEAQEGVSVPKAGSGTVVRITGNLSIPEGCYVLTAEHVVRDGAGKAVITRKDPLVPKLSATTSNGNSFQLSTHNYYCTRSLALGGEAILIPIQSCEGANAIEINKIASSKGEGEGHGYAGGEDFSSFNASQAFKLGGFSLTKNEGGQGAIPGQSGGAVTNSSCEITGVVSGAMGSTTSSSDLSKLLRSPQKCGGGA